MRSTEERVSEAFILAKKIRRRNRRCQLHIAMASSGLLSLAIIILLSYTVPSLEIGAVDVPLTSLSSASLFANFQSLGYLTIGILSFILGVSVTLLCVLLRNRAEENDDDT